MKIEAEPKLPGRISKKPEISFSLQSLFFTVQHDMIEAGCMEGCLSRVDRERIDTIEALQVTSEVTVSGRVVLRR